MSDNEGPARHESMKVREERRDEEILPANCEYFNLTLDRRVVDEAQRRAHDCVREGGYRASTSMS